STATTSPYVLRSPTSRTSGAGGADADGAALTRSRACVDKRLLEDRETFLRLVVRNRQRRKQPEDVPVDAAGQEEQAALEGRVHGRRREGGRGLGELERDHRAEAADLPNLGDAARDGVEAGAQEPAELVRAPLELRLG